MKDRWSGQTRRGGVYLALTVAAARTSPPAPAHIDRLCIVSVALLAPVTLDTAQLLTSLKLWSNRKCYRGRREMRCAGSSVSSSRSAIRDRCCHRCCVNIITQQRQVSLAPLCKIKGLCSVEKRGSRSSAWAAQRSSISAAASQRQHLDRRRRINMSPPGAGAAGGAPPGTRRQSAAGRRG